MNAEMILREARAMQEDIVASRRYLHEHPGTGFDTTEALSYVRKELLAMGYDPQPCGKAGLTALAGGKKPGRVFLLRADMDALPMTEEADVSFPSQNSGKMHACGHDMHTAMLLAAARILKAHESEICGTVKLMFQSAEEIFEGSRDMIEAGVLKNPDVDAALMIHVMANMPLPAGSVIVCDGGISAPGADYFTITVQGKGCHGSMPNTGIDPISAAAHIILALQELHARELALSENAVLTIGTIHGGNAANVIPDSVELTGSIRTYDEDVRTMLKSRMTEIAQSIAAAFRAKVKVTFGSGCPCLKNDAALSACMVSYTKELLGGRAFSVAQLSAMGGGSSSKSAGSEDFACVSQEVPSIMIALAAGTPADGYSYPQHHPKVRFDEAALADGCAVYAYTALRWLEEHS